MNTRDSLPSSLGKLLCVYCLHPNESKDHTPPKKLLREPLPSNLITLPCCRKCNSGYSKNEEIIKIFLAVTSSHPDLQPGTKAGDAARRGLARNTKLQRLIEAQRGGSGFKITPDLFKVFENVLQKTARGLFYGRYLQLHPLTEFRLLSIEDSRSTTVEKVVDRIRPRVEDITEQALPEVSESMRASTFVFSANLMPLGGGLPINLQRVVRFIKEQPVEWVVTQPGIFRFGFVQRQPEGGGAFIMELWSTLIVSVSAPWPGDRGPILKGRSNPLSRERGRPRHGSSKAEDDRPAQD